MTSQKERRPKMYKGKINQKRIISNEYVNTLEIYEHYIAIDWSKRTMAIARLTKMMREPKVIEVRSDVYDLKAYLKSLKGKKILTIEETTTSQWLYVELQGYADKVLICDPYRNRLLSDGSKNDKIDAIKLCLLLRNGLLKEVYHSLENRYRLRQQVSDYEDLVKSGVRLKNQLSAIFRANGDEEIKDLVTKRIIARIGQNINLYEQQKEEYESIFNQEYQKDKDINRLRSVNGIGFIRAVIIVSTVVDARRFENDGQYLSYCGLIKHEKLSGGRSYGRRSPRYCRRLKSVYKSAAQTVINSKDNSLKQYYKYLIDKGVSEDRSRNALARKIARITYGILKTKTNYKPYIWRENKAKEVNSK